MDILTILVTPFQQNARLLIDPSSSEALLVDPGGDVPKIEAEVRCLGVKVKGIILTHAHLDHSGGVQAALEAFEAPTLYAHPLEAEMRANVSKQAMMFGLSPEQYQNSPEPDVYIDEGDVIQCGHFELKVLFTPGHSPGHVSLYCAEPQPTLIAGDTLFAGSIGRTDLPGGDYETLIRSIKEKLFVLPAKTVVMPGHGPDTSIGVEARTNPFLVGTL